MTMDVIRSACRLSGRPSNLPSRPDLNAAARPSRLRPQGQVHASAWSDARLILLRGTARIIAVSQIAFLIAGLAFFEAGACAKNASRAEPADRFAEFIAEASDRFVVPARWIRAVMQVESGGDEHAMSLRGATGLMQIMPGTWADLRIRYGLGLDPFEPHDNISAGTAYLREMYDRFGSAGFLAAYNAGPLRYEQHLTTGRLLPAETLAYVAAVTSLLAPERIDGDASRTRRAVAWRQAPLFVERADSTFADTQSATDARPTSDSTALSTARPLARAPRAAGLFLRR
jgi:soluble lytic murein transglycosylase-like protein